MGEQTDLRFMEAFTTSAVIYSDQRPTPQDYSSRSVESSPSHIPQYRQRSHSHSAGSSPVMNDADKTIYNSLGSTSSPAGKRTYKDLVLNRGWQKKGTMWKSGPSPTWYTTWKKRHFVLKGNFVYYLPVQGNMEEAKVLGAIYLKNSVIEKVTLSFAKIALRITPQVPRRAGSPDDDTAVFYVKFKTEEERNEWFEELQQVAFNHHFPKERKPLIDTTGAFR